MSHADSIHTLTLQTATAMARLAELERSDETRDESTPLSRAALQQLSTVLEELQVANEQLEMHLAELTAMQAESAVVENAPGELSDALPIAVLWTDHAGVIEKGNAAAARLLCADEAQLVGASLSSVASEPRLVFDAIHALVYGQAAVDVEITVAPRNGARRRMLLRGRRLAWHDRQCVWFLDEPIPQTDALAQLPLKASIV
jgi:two-component system, OmpR family, sensor histidine kinase VicK